MLKIEDFGVEKNSGVLNNGSKIFHYYRPNMPISTAVLFDAGSSHDPVGKEGLAHFNEHILFKSTKKFKDETETGLFLESIGGQANAFTGVDLLGVTAEVGVSSDYPKVVEFIHELVRNSLFEEEKINIERGTILGEIADYESNPALHIHDLNQQLLFQGTYASRSIAGSKETVLGISREDLFNFYSSRIANSNMIIVVAGGIEFNDVVDLFNNTFDNEKFPEVSISKPDLVLSSNEKSKIKVYKDIDQIFLSFSFRTCSYNNDDKEVLSIIRKMIGSGFSSSLFRKLRTENGLVYSLSVSARSSVDRGYFSTVTSTSKDKVRKVLEVISEEFERLRNGNIDEGELQLAKDKIIKSKIRNLQTSDSWVGAHLSEVFLNPENPKDVAERLNEMERISINDVISVSKKYFTKENIYLSACGDLVESDLNLNF
jgi:predicted Zn-dependent peptidase